MGIDLKLTEISAKNTQRWWKLTATTSCSQLPPALGVFRRFLRQFWINFHEILQALFSIIPAPTLKIS